MTTSERRKYLGAMREIIEEGDKIPEASESDYFAMVMAIAGRHGFTAFCETDSPGNPGGFTLIPMEVAG